MQGAEEIRLKKKCKDSMLRDFLVEDLKNFQNSGRFHLSDYYTLVRLQRNSLPYRESKIVILFKIKPKITSN